MIEAEKTGEESVRLYIDGENAAEGIWFTSGVLSFDDDDRSVISYPDTGVFVLLKNSRCSCTDKKYARYIVDGRTTKDLVFQSRAAAARFVLGKTGRTNHWKRRD